MNQHVQTMIGALATAAAMYGFGVAPVAQERDAEAQAVEAVSSALKQCMIDLQKCYARECR